MSDDKQVFEPKGLRFWDGIRGEMLLVQQPEYAWDGWLCYRNPDGQWVTLRKATEADLARLKAGTLCFWFGRPPCPACGVDHGNVNCTPARDAELRLDFATNALIAWSLTCRTENSGEWMAGLVDRINRYLAEVGDQDRYHFDGDGFAKGAPR